MASRNLRGFVDDNSSSLSYRYLKTEKATKIFIKCHTLYKSIKSHKRSHNAILHSKKNNSKGFEMLWDARGQLTEKFLLMHHIWIVILFRVLVSNLYVHVKKSKSYTHTIKRTFEWQTVSVNVRQNIDNKGFSMPLVLYDMKWACTVHKELSNVLMAIYKQFTVAVEKDNLTSYKFMFKILRWKCIDERT